MPRKYTVGDVIAALEKIAPLRLQENFDNCGLQVGCPDATATGALLCLDVTEQVVQEAIERRFNLIISHHPLLFFGLKHITGTTENERIVAAAIKNDIAIYSSHTCIDNAPGGVSWRMAQKLDLVDVRTLDPRPDEPSAGCGVIGCLFAPLDQQDFLKLVKRKFAVPAIRYSGSAETVTKVALCGGAGSFLLDKAKEQGADAFISADFKYHELQSNSGILAADIGHFESEQYTKEIFYETIRKKLRNFAVEFAHADTCRIKWLV